MKIVATLVLLVAVSFTSLFISNNLVAAQANLACDGLTGATGNECGENSNDTGGIDNAIKTGLNLLSIAAGIISVVMIMIAGLKFINSQGDSGKVASARNTVIYALVGLGIVALSQTIVFFVVGNKTTTTANGDTQQVQGAT